MVQPTAAAIADHMTPMYPLPIGAALDPFGAIMGREEEALPAAVAERFFGQIQAAAHAISITGIGDLSSLADRVTQSNQALQAYTSLSTFPRLAQSQETNYSYWHSDLALGWDISKIEDLESKLFYPSATLESRVPFLALLERKFVEVSAKAEGTIYLSYEQAARLEEIRGRILSGVDAMKLDGRLPGDAAINIPEFFRNLDVRKFFRSYVLPANRQLAYGANVPEGQLEEIIANTAALPAPLRGSIIASVAVIPPLAVNRVAEVLKALDSALEELPQYTPGPTHVVEYLIQEKARLDAEEASCDQLEGKTRADDRRLMRNAYWNIPMIDNGNFADPEVEVLKGVVRGWIGKASNYVKDRIKNMIWRFNGKPARDPLVFGEDNLVSNLKVTIFAITCAGSPELWLANEAEIDDMIADRLRMLHAVSEVNEFQAVDARRRYDQIMSSPDISNPFRRPDGSFV
ncbi:MAG: hypothetical protein NTX49_05160 [Chlamydiae bacterium]|nr:hypothetical protein [Chlamydiota bacterium]